MNYQIILDNLELNKFIDFLPDLFEDEVYYFSLFARHKYSNAVSNKKDNQLVRFIARKSEIKEKILRLESPIGSYKREGIDIPQLALALYIAINPRSLEKANKTLIMELAKRFADGNINFNPISLANSEIHRATDRKLFVDYDNVDFDMDKFTEILQKDSYKIIKTKGGFHLLVSLVNPQPVKNWFQQLVALEGCDVRGANNMVPVPGCTQGDYMPHFVSAGTYYTVRSDEGYDTFISMVEAWERYRQLQRYSPELHPLPPAVSGEIDL